MSGGSAGARASTGESSRAADERRMHACLDIPIDAEVWSGELLAQRDPLSIAVEPGVDYYLVTRGVFRYSETGRQDGLRRWHEVYDFHEPVCVGCGVAEFEPYTLLADGAAPPWLQECLLEHIHVSLVRASAPTLSLRLSDDCGSCEDPYSDNVGGLAVALYRADGDDPLLARDRPGLRLGVEVGPSHETKWLGLDEAFAKLVYVAGKDHESFYQRHAAWTVEPADQWLVEVSGSAIVSAGVEVDPVAEIDHLQAGVTPVELPVRFECDATQLLAHDSSSHRAVVSLRGCGTQIVARLSDAYPHFIGQLRMTLFSAR